eukprot:Lithocolla_globosa_v1_NODE_39_length_8265_cov_28.628502.p4 type:complete len:122 gc:universal NODE_39_length_8265_cov_28.628502:2553-2918(+)
MTLKSSARTWVDVVDEESVEEIVVDVIIVVVSVSFSLRVVVVTLVAKVTLVKLVAKVTFGAKVVVVVELVTSMYVPIKITSSTASMTSSPQSERMFPTINVKLLSEEEPSLDDTNMTIWSI